MNPLQPLIRREFLEDFMAARGAVIMVVAVTVLSVFSVLLVSNTELSLLDNAEAVYMMASIIIALAALLAVIRGSDGFAGERERETLEALLLAPINGNQVSLAKLLGIVFSWLALYILAIPYIWAVGSTGQNLLATLLYLFITGTLVVFIFGGLALALSARMQSSKGVLLLNMMILILMGSPVILGSSLRQSSVGRVLDMINPMAVALNTLDSVIIDSQGLSYQLVRMSVLVLYFLAVMFSLRSATRSIAP